MSRAILGAVAMLLFLSAGVFAQAADTAQGMMQQRMQDMQGHMEQMQQRMQAMQEHMGQMQHHMQAMRDGMHTAGQDGMPRMQHMQQMQGQQDGAQAIQAMDGHMPPSPGQTCLASRSEAGLTALLMGSVDALTLTEEQRSELQTVLGRARAEALEALTAEQRARLAESPGAVPSDCAAGQGATGGATGHH
jgi:hypothetical protein